VAQIYAAMTWYYDHQVEMDADIERGLQEYRALRDAAGESPGRRQLREKALRPLARFSFQGASGDG
jgi:hypothetical protein